ncbi:MAG TPA: TrbI/VirB10 family protein [Vicinamibacterales bacterium]
MTSRTVAASLLAVGCLTAAAAGSYVAVRQNAADTPTPVATPASPAVPETPAVDETEGVVTPEPARTEPAEQPVEIEKPRETPPPARRVFPRQTPARPAVPARVSTEPEPAAPATPSNEPAVATAPPAVPAPVSTAGVSPEVARAAEPLPEIVPERPAEPVFERIELPASSVIGLEIETTISSEKAEVEDRVNARVTRDVYAEGRLAIPAGSRVIGHVTLVERGGKVKERARLGVRFHTLVIADGRQVPLRTETIYREGESPANDSSRKIGGAAIGGAVLGAILGGGKGAIAGATAGAGAGTAAVMAGGRKPATLTNGSVVTVKLSSPVTLEVER